MKLKLTLSLFSYKATEERFSVCNWRACKYRNRVTPWDKSTREWNTIYDRRVWQRDVQKVKTIITNIYNKISIESFIIAYYTTFKYLSNRYHDIESISKEYAVEKVALEKALSDLKEVEGRKANLLEEKRLEEVNWNQIELSFLMYLSSNTIGLDA